MAKKAKKTRSFIIRCSHCFEQDYKLSDVNPNDKVKFYTDTPYKQGYYTPGGDFKSSEEKPHTSLSLISPCKFQACDESTAFKSNCINTLDKMQEDQLVQVEEDKKEYENVDSSANNEQLNRTNSGGENTLQRQMTRLQDSRKSLIKDRAANLDNE